MDPSNEPPLPPPPVLPSSGAAAQKKFPVLAALSLVLGIVGIPFLGVFGIPAVICGHIARSKIRRSQGTLRGGDTARAALWFGYFQILESILLLPLCSMVSPPARDEELLAAFPTRKPVLEELVAMVQSDRLEREKLWRLGNTGEEATKATGLSATRLEEYRRKMAQIDVVAIRDDHFQPDIGFSVVFLCKRLSRYRAGQDKGYVFLPTPPVLNPANHIVQLDSLDYLDTTTQYIAYRPIAGNWYLYYVGGD